MDLVSHVSQDVMQVCRNGHVITDLLQTFPESGLGHCDRCGAVTFDRCLTCGQPLPGAAYVPDMPAIGRPRSPQYCSACGAAFPWTQRAPGNPAVRPLDRLEGLLRRLPRVIRQLRHRQGERQPFRVEDERDLEDLLRALLPLHFDDIRPESRTPGYSAGRRTDFLLWPSRIAVLAKRAAPGQGEKQITSQLEEDVHYYEKQATCRTLACLVYDPEGRISNPREAERVWSRLSEAVTIRAVIAS
jgi:hypothetical protein